MQCAGKRANAPDEGWRMSLSFASLLSNDTSESTALAVRTTHIRQSQLQNEPLCRHGHWAAWPRAVA